ncbi:MAG: hypothetical protein V8Q21_06795 [Akkermansia muciniphila]
MNNHTTNEHAETLADDPDSYSNVSIILKWTYLGIGNQIINQYLPYVNEGAYASITHFRLMQFNGKVRVNEATLATIQNPMIVSYDNTYTTLTCSIQNRYKDRLAEPGASLSLEVIPVLKAYINSVNNRTYKFLLLETSSRVDHGYPGLWAPPHSSTDPTFPVYLYYNGDKRSLFCYAGTSLVDKGNREVRALLHQPEDAPSMLYIFGSPDIPLVKRYHTSVGATMGSSLFSDGSMTPLTGEIQTITAI